MNDRARERVEQALAHARTLDPEEGERYLRYWFDTTGEEERDALLAEALRRGGHPDKVDWLLGATEEELDRAIGREGLERLARDLRDEERRRSGN
jgi:hypothetical protein